MTLHPERGGSAVMARYAFNEFWSFIAGWAILLDFLILIAISDAVDRPLPDGVLDATSATTAPTLAIALLVLFVVARYNYLGRRRADGARSRWRSSTWRWC